MRRSIVRLTLAVLLGLGGTSCSDQRQDMVAADPDHLPGGSADVIGRHVYTCDSGAEYLIDFLSDGLTVDLTAADGKPVRLTAPAQGLTYVGHKLNARISGSELHVLQMDRPALLCRRVDQGRKR